jgi:hypothetical protein
MNLTPNNFFQASAVLLPCTSLAALVLDGPIFASGILASGAVLLVNLYFWVWFVRRLMDAMVEGGSATGLGLFIGLKLLVLSTSMLVLMHLFSPSVVIVGNSVVAAAILLPALFSSLKTLSPGYSNE